MRGAPFRARFWCGGAPFLGSILVRGVWCADFGVDFGARCAVFGLDFGARCAPFLDSILVCGVCDAPILGSILVRGAPFLDSILVRGVWCADFGVDFGARCAFWVRFWCAVCGAPIVVLIFGFDFGACRAHGKM